MSLYAGTLQVRGAIYERTDGRLRPPAARRTDDPAPDRYATYRTRTDRPIPVVVLTPHA